MTLKAAVNQNDIMHFGEFLSGNYILNAHAHLLLRISMEAVFRFQMPPELLYLVVLLLLVIDGQHGCYIAW